MAMSRDIAYNLSGKHFNHMSCGGDSESAFRNTLNIQNILSSREQRYLAYKEIRLYNNTQTAGDIVRKSSVE